MWISSSPPLPHFLWSFVTWCVTMQFTDMMFKVCQENISHTQTIDIRQVACCLLFYHLNVTEEIETHQTRLRVYSLPLSNFLIWSVFWVVCFLFLANRSDTQCGLLQGLNMLCTQRWSSTFLGCIEWLFDLLLHYYHNGRTEAVCFTVLWSLALRKQSLFFFSCPFSVKPRDMWENPADQQLLIYPDQPSHQTLFKVT